MAAWSNFFRSVGQAVLQSNKILNKNVFKPAQTRCMSEVRVFETTHSRWQWHKTKDMIHLYTLIGAIPIGIAVFITYVFVGPATLEEIPEGYVPKHWEYYRNPITRFIAYMRPSPQQEYEKYLHYAVTQFEIQKVRLLEDRIRKLIKERGDYRVWYYKPNNSLRYLYKNKEQIEDLHKLHGLKTDSE